MDGRLDSVSLGNIHGICEESATTTTDPTVGILGLLRSPKALGFNL